MNFSRFLFVANGVGLKTSIIAGITKSISPLTGLQDSNGLLRKVDTVIITETGFKHTG